MDANLTGKPIFIVLRAARGTPPGFMPADREGRWYYRADLLAVKLEPLGGWPPTTAVAFPTGRVEHRDDDDASAEVWEVHPVGGNYDPEEWGLPL